MKLPKWLQKKLKADTSHTGIYIDNGLSDNYLFDFRNYAANSVIGTEPSGFIAGGVSLNSKSEEPQTIKVKPKDVLHELEVIPTPFSLLLLDQKITILKDKEALINQHYSKREVTALIERLENRKKYPEHKEFFDRFNNTTDEKIEVLLDKYPNLLMKSADIFIPEFPDDAIAVMKEYTEKVKTICSKAPVFYVIAEQSLFKKSYEKRDPILLVQSPFGFYWQILGAWDKEMLLLSEL